MNKLGFISPHHGDRHVVAAELWQRAVNPAVFDACEAASDPQQHFLIRDPKQSAFFSCAQRQEFLELLTERTRLLELMSLEEVTKVFVRCRHGAGDAAVRLLGSWMLLHPDVEPDLSINFYDDNRQAYRELTIRLVWQDKRGIELLQDEYLELSDGSCSLPAAYTVAYGHLVQDKLADWVSVLDAKLANANLVGDQRVNWLLARAHAAELQGTRADRHKRSPERTLAGRDWIVEAELVSEGDGVKTRIRKELVARRVGLREFALARDLIADPVASLPPSAANSWQQQIDGLEAEFGSLLDAEQNAITDARIAELRRRQQMASDQGEAELADRYGDLVDELESASE